MTIKLFEAQEKTVRKVEPPDPNDFRHPRPYVPPTYQKPFADDSATVETKVAKVQVGDDGYGPFPSRGDPKPRENYDGKQRISGTMQLTPKGFESDWSGDGRGLPFTIKK